MDKIQQQDNSLEAADQHQQDSTEAQSTNRSGRRPSRGGRRFEEKKEFDSRILDLARVTRVTKGGKRMRFRACVILGDRKGRVGCGVAKGADVQQAVDKATNKAKKIMVRVPITEGTVPHEIRHKYAAASVIIKPAPEGTGVKAGGAVRVVLELAGVPNVVAKILGSNNKINNARATLQALRNMKGGSTEIVLARHPEVTPSSEGRKKSPSRARSSANRRNSRDQEK